MGSYKATHRNSNLQSDRIDLLARTGAVLDTRRNTIAELHDFERKLPERIAIMLMLALGLGLWALIFWIFGLWGPTLRALGWS